MPSQLVDDVRALLRERAEAGRPLTALERTFLLAAMAPRTATGSDVVDELEAAITDARRYCLTDPPPQVAREDVDKARRAAVVRLLAAARAAIDYDPVPPATDDVDHPADPRPRRADVDG